MKLTMLTRGLRSSERAREKCTFHTDYTSKEQSVSVFFRFELFCLKVDMSVRQVGYLICGVSVHETSSSSRVGASLSIVYFLLLLLIYSIQAIG